MVVIDEFAQRVPERSPPSNCSSTPSAFAPRAMVSTLSVRALISSREYIQLDKATSGYDREQDSPPPARCDGAVVRVVRSCLRAARRSLLRRRPIRSLRSATESEVRRPLYVRAREIRDRAWWLLVARSAGVV